MDTQQVLKQIESLRSGLEALAEMVLGQMPQFPKDKLVLIEQKICLGCGEPKDAKKGRFLRGNHESCYRTVLREIDAGELTDAEAVEQGLLAPVDISGRPKAKSAARDYVAAKKAKKPERKRKSD